VLGLLSTAVLILGLVDFFRGPVAAQLRSAGVLLALTTTALAIVVWF
jgi:hypothetical protein